MIDYILTFLNQHILPNDRWTTHRLSASTSYQTSFQDGYTPTMEGIINLHHDIMFFITIIIVFVFWTLFNVIFLANKDVNKYASETVHGSFIEFIWTVIPSLLLVIIAFPTFALIYSLDEGIEPSITVKAIGHQWYWSYEYSDYIYDVESSDANTYEFDSYMLTEEYIESPDQLRLLDVDNPIYLPVDTHVRVIITSADVLHCWCVPALGIKMDAVPGRLNQVALYMTHEGTFYGQCTELCGANHAFMPIVVHSVDQNSYINWISNALAEEFA